MNEFTLLYLLYSAKLSIQASIYFIWLAESPSRTIAYIAAAVALLAGLPFSMSSFTSSRPSIYQIRSSSYTFLSGAEALFHRGSNTDTLLASSSQPSGTSLHKMGSNGFFHSRWSQPSIFSTSSSSSSSDKSAIGTTFPHQI
jgi:hypothetical protein